MKSLRWLLVFALLLRQAVEFECEAPSSVIKSRGRRRRGMNVEAYLLRIGVTDRPEVADLSNLDALCRAHLRSVPFENFDIHLGVPLSLDPKQLFHKIVRRKRGGLCYELNILFGELLQQLGYAVDYLSARVVRGRQVGPAFDHLALRVWVGGAPYLVDIGFGDGSTLPVPMMDGRRALPHGQASLCSTEEGLFYSAPRGNKGYLLSLESRAARDFDGMCLHHQTHADSWFTRARVACLLTDTGPATLMDGTLRLPGRQAQELSVADTLIQLRTRFGIDLPRLPNNLSQTFGYRIQSVARRWHSIALSSLR